MMKNIRVSCISLLFSLFLFSHAFSQNIHPQNRVSARAIGLGNAVVASLQSPLASLRNPAALALIQDMQLSVSARETNRIGFLGLAKFYPDLGSIGLTYSRTDVYNANSPGQVSVFERASFAYGKSFSDAFLAGSAVHWNRTAHNSNALTFSLSLLVFPATSYDIQRLFPNSGTLFNNVILPQKFSIGLLIQDIPIGRQIIAPSVDVGSYYRLFKNGPTVLAAARFSEHDETIGVGANLPVKHYLSVFAGIEKFDIHKSALGLSVAFPRQSLDLSYSFAEKAFFLDFTTRIGKSPLERAQSYRDKGIRFAKQNQHRRAYTEIKKYLSYLPDDAEAIVLQNWLTKQIHARENQIKQLIDIATEHEEKQWYIRAALIYKHILKLDQHNEYARVRLVEIKPDLENNLTRLFEVGLAAFQQGNFKTAERAFSTVLKVQPGHESATLYLQRINSYYAQKAEDLYYQGLGYFNQERYENAISAFEQALEFSHDNLEASKYLALSRQKQSEVENQTDKLFEQAQQYEKRKQILNAYHTYKKIIALNPENHEANFALRQLAPKVDASLQRMLSRGKAYFENGDFENARSLFQTLLSYDATSAAANEFLTRIENEDKRRIDELYRKGMAEFDRKRWDKAIALFDSVLSMQSTYESAREKRREALAKSSFEELLNTADAFYLAGKYMKAIDYYEQVRSRVPANQNIIARIADCREKLNAFVDLHFSRAINLYAAQDYRGAIRELKAVLEANPGHIGSQEYLKKAQKRLIAIETLQ